MSRLGAYVPRQTMGPANSSNKLWRRRDVVKLLGATAITGPIILRGTTASAATSKVIKIGHVSPQTGGFASFAEADPFILNQIRTVLAKGITNAEASYEVQIITKDSQSNTNRASDIFTYSKPEVQCGASLQDTRAGKVRPKVSDLYRGGRKCPDKVYSSKKLK